MGTEKNIFGVFEDFRKMQRNLRMKREIENLSKNPPSGVSCWPASEDRLDELEASLIGPDESPFEGGVFSLKVTIPERYPFEPPNVQFVTKVYHPNVDTSGRICLDFLKMPPAGSWKPSLNVAAILTSIRVLLAEPNPKDPLMVDIAREYESQPVKYEHTAREWTKKFASQQKSS